MVTVNPDLPTGNDFPTAIIAKVGLPSSTTYPNNDQADNPFKGLLN